MGLFYYITPEASSALAAQEFDPAEFAAGRAKLLAKIPDGGARDDARKRKVAPGIVLAGRDPGDRFTAVVLHRIRCRGPGKGCVGRAPARLQSCGKPAFAQTSPMCIPS